MVHIYSPSTREAAARDQPDLHMRSKPARSSMVILICRLAVGHQILIDMVPGRVILVIVTLTEVTAYVNVARTVYLECHNPQTSLTKVGNFNQN